MYRCIAQSNSAVDVLLDTIRELHLYALQHCICLNLIYSSRVCGLNLERAKMGFITVVKLFYCQRAFLQAAETPS